MADCVAITRVHRSPQQMLMSSVERKVHGLKKTGDVDCFLFRRCLEHLLELVAGGQTNYGGLWKVAPGLEVRGRVDYIYICLEAHFRVQVQITGTERCSCGLDKVLITALIIVSNLAVDFFAPYWLHCIYMVRSFSSLLSLGWKDLFHNIVAKSVLIFPSLARTK